MSNFWPAMAVPMTVKMPDPITAPMPRAVSDHGPSDFLSAFSGSSDSRISLSMDLQASSWLGRAVLLVSQCTLLRVQAVPVAVGKPYAAVYMMRFGRESDVLTDRKPAPERRRREQCDGREAGLLRRVKGAGLVRPAPQEK